MLKCLRTDFNMTDTLDKDEPRKAALDKAKQAKVVAYNEETKK
ncbi:hypothetical protein J0S82_006383, partial [Galemys pyrenaicus]